MCNKLSICIPTYNRAELLDHCLRSLIPQIEGSNNIEIIVSNNASTDNTEYVVRNYIKHHRFIKYFKNPENLGFDGNTTKCIERSTGEYTALLADDDSYTNGSVQVILDLISKQSYSLICLNYFNIKNPDKMFAEEKNVIFPRPFELLNYPSVGHFSGFIYNSKMAKEILQRMIILNPLVTCDRSRGIYLELAVRLTKGSNLPAYFIGKRMLATTSPKVLDYKVLFSDCLGYYLLFNNLFKEGVISKEDLSYREKLVMSWLPKEIIKSIHQLNTEEVIEITKKFKTYFKGNKRFNLVSFPMLYIGRYYIVRKICNLMVILVHFIKHKNVTT